MCPLKLFSPLPPHPRRTATRARPDARRWVRPPPSLRAPGAASFPGKSCRSSWCVRAQTWAQSGRGGIERHRETEAAGRESERSGPLFPLSDAGRVEGRTCGDAQARIPATFGRTRRAMAGINCQRHPLQVRVWVLSCRRISFCVSWRCCDAQDKANRLSEVCGGKGSFAHAGLEEKGAEWRVSAYKEFLFELFLLTRAVALWLFLWRCEVARALWEFWTMQSGVNSPPKNTTVAQN